MKPNDKSGQGDKKPQQKLTPQDSSESQPLPKKRFEQSASAAKKVKREDDISGQFQNWGL